MYRMTQGVQHAQVSFHLSPDAAVQLVAYDAALGAYAALQRPRALTAAHATITLPAQLALRAVSLRPRGMCLNQALPGLGLEAVSESGSGPGAGSECVPSLCEPRCQRGGDVELTRARERGQDAAPGASGSPPYGGHAAEHAAWSTCSPPAAPASAAVCAAVGAAEILPVSVSALAGSRRPTERAPSAAELWAGYQAAQVRSI